MLILVTDPNDSIETYSMLNSDLNTRSRWHSTIEDALAYVTTHTTDISYHNWTLETWQKELPEYIITEYISIPLPYEYW